MGFQANRKSSTVLATVALALWPASRSAVAQRPLTGSYQTTVAAVMEECGDWLTIGSVCEGIPNFPGRHLPLSATVMLELNDTESTMTALLENAVWEGGDPFALSVASSSGQLTDAGYRFLGDYYPPVPGYLFDWEFSAAGEGRVLWNGTAQWTGGHLWQLTFDSVLLVPVPEPCGAAIAVAFCALAGCSYRRMI